MRLKNLLIFLIFLLVYKVSFSQALIANAGPDHTVCPGSTVVIGSSVPATGGTSPYTFNWSPSTGLSSSSVSSPTLTATGSATYVLTVTDRNALTARDTVKIIVPDFSPYGAGSDVTFCGGTGVKLGNMANASALGYTFNWSPSTGLNNASSPNPVANPAVNTTYTLVISKNGCTNKSTVTVNLSNFSLELNTHDTTIYEGNTITLISNASATSFWWTPAYMINYANTSSPDVSPLHTTTYSVMAIAENGCVAYDTVRVTVIPSDELVFYSAFTPNGDGDNDYFYIGNILKFPDNILKIYNRYGQVIFTSAGYKNDWDGSYQGNKVPTGTYFYILDTGTERGQYKGSVTILR